MLFADLQKGHTFTWAKRFPNHMIQVVRSQTSYASYGRDDARAEGATTEEPVHRWGRFKEGGEVRFADLPVGAAFTWRGGKDVRSTNILFVKRNDTEYQWIGAMSYDPWWRGEPDDVAVRWGRFQEEAPAA